MPGWKDRWIGVRMEGRKDSYGRVDRWRDGWMDNGWKEEGKKYRWKDEQIGGKKEGQTNS